MIHETISSRRATEWPTFDKMTMMMKFTISVCTEKLYTKTSA